MDLRPDETLNKAELNRIQVLVQPKIPLVSMSPAKNSNVTSENSEKPAELVKYPKSYTPEGLAINKSIATIYVESVEKLLEDSHFGNTIHSRYNIVKSQVESWATKYLKYLNESKHPQKKTSAKGKKPKPKSAPSSSAVVLDDSTVTLRNEWNVALNSEIGRTKLRIWAIGQKIYHDMAEIFNCGQSAFHGIYKNISR